MKSVIDCFRDFFKSKPESSSKPPIEAKPDQAPIKPAESKPNTLAEAKSKSKDEPKDKPGKGPKLVCTLQNEDSKSEEIIKLLKAKTRRRALRHFEGKEIRHRVTEKKADSIEFAFYRRSGKPVRIRWAKLGIE